MFYRLLRLSLCHLTSAAHPSLYLTPLDSALAPSGCSQSVSRHWCLPIVLWMTQALPPSRSGWNHTLQPVRYSLLLLISYSINMKEARLPLYRVSTVCCPGSRVVLRTPHRHQELYTSVDWKIICSDCSLAQSLSLSLIASKCSTWSSSSYLMNLHHFLGVVAHRWMHLS